MSRARPGTKAFAAALARRERQRRDRSLQVQVFASARVSARIKRLLTEKLLAAHAVLRPALRSLSVALVGDRRMSALHEQFMGIAGPTDVLTFPLDHDARGRATAGEVVVCVPEAVRRAREAGIPMERELLLYALHGLLHLCGYDDRTEPGYRRMHRREDMILTQLGVGPVFAGALPRRTTGQTRNSRGATRRASDRGTAHPGDRATRRVAAEGTRP